MEQWCWVVSVWADRYHYLESSLNSYVSMDKKIEWMNMGKWQGSWALPTPWTAACQASLPSTISQSLLKLISTESVIPSNHLILCHPLILLPSIFPIVRVFSNESALPVRWPQYWTFSFNISPSNENTQHWSPLGWTGWIFLQSKGLSRVFSNTTVQKHQFFGTQLSL